MSDPKICLTQLTLTYFYVPFIPSKTLSSQWLYEPRPNHASVPWMIYVLTAVYKDHGPEGNQYPENPPAWRVQSCTIDFGADLETTILTSDLVYASPEAAHDDMKQQALERIRLNGYTVSEGDIVWRLHMIG